MCRLVFFPRRTPVQSGRVEALSSEANRLSEATAKSPTASASTSREATGVRTARSSASLGVVTAKSPAGDLKASLPPLEEKKQTAEGEKASGEH